MDFVDVSFGSDEEDTSGDEFCESDDEIVSSKKTLEELTSYLEKFKRWGRTDRPQVEGQKLTKLYLLDCDAWACPTIRSTNEKPGTSRSHVIRLSGIGEHGETVSCFVTGFLPYFYVTYPNELSEQDLDEFKHVLNHTMITELNQNPTLVSYSRYFDGEHPPVLEISRSNPKEIAAIFGFHSPKSSTVKTALKVSCKLTRFVNLASKVIAGGNISLSTLSTGDSNKFQCYEHQLSPNMRFLTSLNLACCSWVELVEPVNIHSGTSEELLKSHSQIEFEVDYKMLIPNGSTPPNTDLPDSLRVLSVDIEVWCRPPFNGCPRNGSTEIIQIGNVLKYGPGPKDFVKVMFALGSVDPLPDAEIFSFDCEKLMLHAWSAFVVAVDPDVISGYNICKFDLPYMLQRAEVLGISGFPYLSRFQKSPAYYREIKKVTKRINKFGSPIAQVPGRVVLDMLPLIMQVFPNRGPGQYKLGAVAKYYLKNRGGDLKDDVQYYQIDSLQKKGPSVIDGRGKLAKYCLQDAWLVLQLMNVNPCDSCETDFLKYFALKAATSGSPLRYHMTKSETYNKYYKTVRKSKNPDVSYQTLPSTGEKRKIHDMSTERANKVRRSLFPDAESGPSKLESSSTATGASVAVATSTPTATTTVQKITALTQVNQNVLSEESLTPLDYGKSRAQQSSPNVPGTTKALYSYTKICKQLRTGGEVDLSLCIASPEPVDPDLEHLGIDSWSESDFDPLPTSSQDLIPQVEEKLSLTSVEYPNLP